MKKNNSVRVLNPLVVLKLLVVIVGLLMGAGQCYAQNIQYLLSNSTIPIGLSNRVTATAVEAQKVGVGIDVKLTGAGTSGIAFILDVSNDNTNWCATPIQFWRAANGATAVTHYTNFTVDAAPFLRWTIHNSNSVAVTNSTITMNAKKDYR
jgi:hypothetical protein